MAEMRVGTDHRALLYVSAHPGSYYYFHVEDDFADGYTKAAGWCS